MSLEWSPEWSQRWEVTGRQKEKLRRDHKKGREETEYEVKREGEKGWPRHTDLAFGGRSAEFYPTPQVLGCRRALSTYRVSGVFFSKWAYRTAGFLSLVVAPFRPLRGPGQLLGCNGGSFPIQYGGALVLAFD